MPNKTEVKNKYADPGPLCKCRAHREGPGPDHKESCPWYANTRCEVIRLIPHLGADPVTGRPLDMPMMEFKFVPWVKP